MRPPDYRNIGESVSYPGIDPRSWVFMARVDDDPDAVVWDPQLGWLVDVTAVSGDLAGEGPITCRVSSDAQGSNVTKQSPPRYTGVVIAVNTSGDPNEAPIILGQLHNSEDAFVTPTINDSVIVETEATEGQVAAAETHITYAPDEDLDQQWRNVRITADEMVLGTPNADQPFVRGTDIADALDDLASAISDIVTAINTSLTGLGGPISPDALATFTIAIQTFQAAREQYLSTRIDGD